MKRKSMIPSEDRMLVWISKRTHRILKIEAARTDTTIGDLADNAITSYYNSIVNKTKI